MTEEKILIVEKSLNNFFNCNRGSIFFKPEVFSTLEEAHFEDVTDWATQNLIKDSVTASLAKYFPALEISHNGLKFIYDSRSGNIDIQIIASVDGSIAEFKASLYKGVRTL